MKINIAFLFNIIIIFLILVFQLFSSISPLLKGRSPEEIAQRDPTKLKSAQKLQAVLHTLRAVIILLGITLVILGITGTIGLLPSLIAGGLLLTASSGLLIPLCIHKSSTSRITTTDTESETSTSTETESSKTILSERFPTPWQREAVSKGYYKIELESVEKNILGKLQASKNQGIKKEIQLSRSKAIKTMVSCGVEELGTFYIPLFLLDISQKPELLKLLEPKHSKFISFYASYILVMLSLINIDDLILETKKQYQVNELLFDDSISENTKLLVTPQKNCGMQLLRTGLKLLYQNYSEIRSLPGPEEIWEPGGSNHKLSLLYYDALANLRRVFNMSEVQQILKLNEDQESVSLLRNADFLLKVALTPAPVSGSPFPLDFMEDPSSSGYDTLD